MPSRRVLNREGDGEKPHMSAPSRQEKRTGLARATSEAGLPITKSRRWWRKAVSPGTFKCEKGRKDTGSREMPLLRKLAEAANDFRRLKNTPKAVYIRPESSLYILVILQPPDFPRIAFYKNVK